MAAGAARPVPLTWTRVFPARPDQVGEARRFLALILDGLPAAEDAILCVSELVTNAVIHSRSRRPGGCFTVSAGIRPGDRLRIEVADQGGRWAQPVSTDGQHGRGLLIVGRLARTWGVTGDPGAGRTVWFEIAAGQAVSQLGQAAISSPVKAAQSDV